MKKNHFLLKSISVVLLFLICASCGKDEAKGLKGLYVSEIPTFKEYCIKGYDFQNKNTVIYYDNIANYQHWTGYTNSVPVPGLSGCYYQEGCQQTYTYYVDDNKIYIPEKGSILTISGNKLMEGSWVFTKH